MPKTARPTHPIALRRARARVRRGNTLVLVTAILVLLVIVAVAFLSRTQAGRQISSAQQASESHDQRVQAIATDLAALIGDSLFPRPVDPTAYGLLGAGHRIGPSLYDPTDPSLNVATATSSYSRLAIEPNARIYGIDRDFNGDLVPDSPYNFAPANTVPWTNWPDFLSPLFPRGAGQPDGIIAGVGGGPISDDNPYGNAGYGDHRWLCDVEPVRVDSNGDGVPDTYTHWRHMSFIGTAENGYRLVPDITDVSNNVLFSLNEADFTTPFALGIPYEQWLVNFVPPQGIPTAAQFNSLRNAWFAAPSAAQSYATNYASGGAMPNLFRIGSMDQVAPGIPNPNAAFVQGTTSHAILATLADASGSGFTDSFWFEAPVSIDRSIKYLIAARIIDNSALVNANTATIFNRHNTTGAAPYDVALKGVPGTPGLEVGFFDNPANRFPTGPITYPTLWSAADANLYAPVTVGWSPNRFGDGPTDSLTFLEQVGMKFEGAVNPFMADPTYPAGQQAEWLSPRERQLYYRNSALRRDDPRFGLTPFSVGDEIELRAYEASNDPWKLSRLERAIDRQGDVFANFLRISPERQETTPYLHQLSGRGYLLDNRKKLTVFSGARNDLRPAWMWPSPYADPRIDYNADGLTADTDGNPATIEVPAAAGPDLESYLSQTRKLDLRRPFDAPDASSPGNVLAATDPVIEGRAYAWRNELRGILEKALTRSWVVPGGAGAQYQSYLGSSDNPDAQYQREQYDKTRQMVASYTANISQYCDRPTVFGSGNNLILRDGPLHPAIGVQDPIDGDLRYIGMEKQPFLMEVFVALVYPKSKIDPALKAELAAAGVAVNNDYVIPNVFADGGEHFVDSSVKPGVVIAVQIANPYDTPISLLGFGLRMFGKNYPLASAPQGPAVTLGPASEGRPTTAIVYAIKSSPDDDTAPGTFPFVGTWLDFLDIEPAELYDGQGFAHAATRVFDASGHASWSALLDVDSPAEDPNDEFNDPNEMSVELVRLVDPPVSLPSIQQATVVVDRIDNVETGPQLKFAESLSRLFTDSSRFPPMVGFDFDASNPPERNFMNGIRIGTDDYFIAWARTSRPWTWDVVTPPAPFDRKLTPDESNPRYVFSVGSKPTLASKTKTGNVNSQDITFKGDTYAFNQDPDGASLWISQSYRSVFDEERRGKPTNFPCVAREQVGVADNVYGLGFPYPDPVTQVYPDEATVGEKLMDASDWSAFDSYTALKSPFQMLQKDDDFEQIGELLNVFCWGHVLDVGAGVTTPDTERTFSEILLEKSHTDDQPAGGGVFVNRLRVSPFGGADSPSNSPTPILSTPWNAPYIPSIPAGAGIFDAVVCDDRGLRRLDGLDGSVPDGQISQAEVDATEFLRPGNAAGFAGRLTPGSINLNSALPETLAAMPNMSRLVNNDLDFNPNGTGDQLSIAYGLNPFTRVVDSILRYRDRATDAVSGTIVPIALPWYPAGYVERGLAAGDAQAPIPPGLNNTSGFMGPTRNGASGNGILTGLRGERGFASIGELLLLQRLAQDPSDNVDSWQIDRSYSIQFAGLDPYRMSEVNVGASGVEYANTIASRHSTDVTNGRLELNPNQTTPALTRVPDRVGGDAEDCNLLFNGMSNIVSTRSDVFTVWFRVRAVRQDPTSGVWNATRPDLIADDSRYVMVVDRSNVQRPGDKPRILALRKVGG